MAVKRVFAILQPEDNTMSPSRPSVGLVPQPNRHYEKRKADLSRFFLDGVDRQDDKYTRGLSFQDLADFAELAVAAWIEGREPDESSLLSLQIFIAAWQQHLEEILRVSNDGQRIWYRCDVVLPFKEVFHRWNLFGVNWQAIRQTEVYRGHCLYAFPYLLYGLEHVANHWTRPIGHSMLCYAERLKGFCHACRNLPPMTSDEFDSPDEEDNVLY